MAGPAATRRRRPAWIVATAAFALLAASGGATAASHAQAPPGLSPEARAHLITPAFAAKLHARKGSVTTSRPIGKPRAKPISAAFGFATDPAEAGTLASAIEHTGSTFVTGASFVTVPNAGQPDLTSDDAAFGSPVTAPGFPADGTNFAILTTGDATLAPTANTTGDAGTCDSGGTCDGSVDEDPNTKGPNRQTAHDVTILKIAMTIPAGMNCLSFDYRFLSEEYPEWLNTQYNDAFLAELDKNTWTAPTSGDPRSPIIAPNNFAFDPAHSVISINAAGNTSMSPGYATGTTYDGATPLLTASTPITAGSHTLYLSIFDQGDYIYDSAAFVDNLRLAKVATGQCGSGSVVSQPPADVSLTKSAEVANSDITYTLTAKNNGPNPAEDVSIVDPLPNGTSFDTADAGCANNGGIVTCSLGELNAGDSVQKQIEVTAGGDGDYTNVANVTASTFDPLLQNNTASVTNHVGAGGPASTDLQIVKTGPGTAAQGDFVEYQLVVTNNGPDDSANGFTITDTLPSNVFFDYYMLAGGGFPTGFYGCFQDVANTVTCQFAPPFTLAGNGTDSVEIDLFAYVLTTGTNVKNTAVVAPLSDDDPNDANNSSTSTITSISATSKPTGDVTVTKTVDKLLQDAGGPLTYTIKVTNTGKVTLPTLEIFDNGGFNTVDVSVADTLGGCTTTGNGIGPGFDCTIALGPGKSDTFTYKSTISNSASDGDFVFNSVDAILSSAYFDPKPGNNSASAFTKVGAGDAKSADLESFITTPSSAGEGDAQSTTLKVINHGTSPVTMVSTGVDFNDVSDGGATILPLPAGCAMNFGFAECDAGTLASGASKTFVFQWNAPTTDGSYVVSSFAHSDDPLWVDPNGTNNDKDAPLTVAAASADVSVTKVATPEPILNGTALTYKITVSNAGPAPATGTQLIDDLPDGVTLNSIKGATCAGSTILSCNLGTVAVGKPVVVTIVVTPSLDPGTLPDQIVNHVTVSSLAGDPNLDNNMDSATSTVNPPEADLSITKTAKPDPVLNNGKLTYTVVVHNAGPQDATTVAIEDDLPASETLVSAKLAGTTCTGTTTIQCTLAKLKKGASATLTITVTVNDGNALPDTVENTASVDADQLDPDTADNSVTLDTTVNPPNADLALSEKAAPATVKPNGSVAYTFSIKNNGPLKATSVQLTVAFTGGVVLPATLPLGCVANDAAHITCSGYVINPLATKVITVVAKAPNTSNTTLEADGAVSSAVLDLNSGNDSASASSHTP